MKPHIMINRIGNMVQIWMDTTEETYGDWIKGEDSTTCLYRSVTTNKVMGVCLSFKEGEEFSISDVGVDSSFSYKAEKDE